MANKKKRKGARTTSPARTTGPQTPDEIMTAVLQRLPLLNGNYDHRAFATFFKGYRAYETWAATPGAWGNATPALLDELPGYYRRVLADPDAFALLRHSLRRYMRTVPFEPAFGPAVESLVRRACAADPAGFDAFVTALDDSHERVRRQWRNARTEHDRARNATGQERLEGLVRWFAHFFEVDVYLWFLGVVARAATTGRTDPGLFGGPDTHTPQASLAKSVADSLDSHPLGPVVAHVYDADLRNALSHNDYEWATEDDGTTTLVDHHSGRRFAEPDLCDLLVDAQSFKQALLSTIFNLVDEPSGDARQRLAGHGVTDHTWLSNEDGLAGLVVFQLWCFAELDPEGSWIDSSTVTVVGHECDEDQCAPVHWYTRLSPGTYLDEPAEAARMDAELEDAGWVQVWRIPVAPDIGAPGHRLRLPSGDYVLVGVPDCHFVPYDGTEHVPADASLFGPGRPARTDGEPSA